MKKLGLFLVGMILFLSLGAQNPTQTATDSTNKSEVVNDNIEKLYMSSELDAREALLLQKLTSEQLYQLEQQRLDNQRRADQNKIPLAPVAIVLIVIAPFLMVVLIVFFSIRAKKEREKARYNLYLKSIESGQPLPETFFNVAERKSSSLKRGAIWLAVGLGVVIYGLLDFDTDIIGLGAIPALVGVAFLIVYFIEKPKDNDKTPSVNE